MTGSIDFIRELIRKRGSLPLLQGVDSESRPYHAYVHPATPSLDDHLVLLLVGEDGGSPHSITFELPTAALHQLLEVVALLIAAHHLDDPPQGSPAD